VKLEAINALPLIPTLHELDADIPLGAVKVAIKLLNNNKAPGADGIPAEVLKCGGEALAAKLHAVFELCWRTLCLPQDFKDANIITLYKNKGSRQDCNSYRGISLLSVAGKVLSRVLLPRLQVIADRVLPESQLPSLHCTVIGFALDWESHKSLKHDRECLTELLERAFFQTYPIQRIQLAEVGCESDNKGLERKRGWVVCIKSCATFSVLV